MVEVWDVVDRAISKVPEGKSSSPQIGNKSPPLGRKPSIIGASGRASISQAPPVTEPLPLLDASTVDVYTGEEYLDVKRSEKKRRKDPSCTCCEVPLGWCWWWW
jgi:hypothetical protein